MKHKPNLKPILGRDPVSQLYRAIIRYVESRGGKVVVIGGIETQEWPGEFEYNFKIAVRCSGNKPTVPVDYSRGLPIEVRRITNPGLASE